MSTTIHSYRPDLLRVCGSITGPASYLAGGFSPELGAAAGFGEHIEITNAHINVRSTTYDGYYNKATGKIIAVVRATGAEVADTTNLSSVVFEMTAFLNKS